MDKIDGPRPIQEVVADLLDYLSNWLGNPPTFQKLCVELLAAAQPTPPAAESELLTKPKRPTVA